MMMVVEIFREKRKNHSNGIKKLLKQTETN